MAIPARVLLLVSLLFVCQSALPADAEQANFSITFDLTAAQAILALFDSVDPVKDDVAALLKKPAVQATIVQTNRFSKSATEQVYVDSLWAILDGQKPKHDPFNFLAVQDRLTSIRDALQEISEQNDTISNRVSQRIASYAPSYVNIETTLYAVLGGTSDGWAPGDGSFYIAMHYFRDDIPGFTSMVTHEMYHIAQQEFFSDIVDDTQTRPARRLISNLLAEGTATLVANPTELEGTGRYLASIQDKHIRNLERIRDNFALFEALYYRAMVDSDVRFGQLYNLGFSGNWDSPLYFVGFRIAEALEKYMGRAALIELLAQESGANILSEYVRVYTENSDPELVRFTQAVENQIQSTN